MRSPDEIAQDEEAKEYLRAVAAVAGDFYAALHDAGLPEQVSSSIVIAWHESTLETGVVWESPDD